MKLVLAVFAVSLLLVGFSSAQDSPALEVFAGYSLEHISACGAPGDAFLTCSQFIETGNSSAANYNGWNTALSVPAYKFISVTADLGIDFGTTDVRVFSAPTTRVSFMFGPTATLRRKTYSPFAHALFGGVSNKFGTFSIPGSQSQDSASVPNYTKFAWAIGGGLDLNIARHLAARVGQFDYERVNVPGAFNGYPAVGGFRFSAGIVIKR